LQTTAVVTWNTERSGGYLSGHPNASAPVPPIPHSRPTLHDDLVQAASLITRSGMIAAGRYGEHFERLIADMHSAPGAVATSSGTSALHLALLALRLGTGDEVILPSYVCTAVLNAVRYVGATPVLADIDEESFNIDPEDVRARITSRTRAIIVAHMFGVPADVRSLRSFGIPIIEDCAQALGATIGGLPVGSYGDLAVFSFYATKVITTGEGGMVLARNPALVDRMRDLRDYDERDSYELRFNYHMSDLAAAVGCRQFERLSGFLSRREELANLYHREVAGLPLRPQAFFPGRVYYRYVVRTEAFEFWQQALQVAGVQCKRPVYKPLHHYLGGHFPVTESVYRTALSLPIYPSLTDDEACRVVTALAEHDQYIEHCVTLAATGAQPGPATPQLIDRLSLTKA
jgi:perosamine synthetase